MDGPAELPPDAEFQGAGTSLPKIAREPSDLALELLRAGIGLRDWILTEGSRSEDATTLLASFAERIGALGVVVDRISTAIDALHSEYSGVGRMWTRDGGSSYRLFPHGEASQSAYLRSPFAEVHRTGEWLFLDLDETSDDRFDVVAELKEQGYRSYVCIPIAFAGGSRNGISLASRERWAFSGRAERVLRFVVPTLAAAIETRSVNQRLDNVLRIYVGDEPHRAILSGAIRRGQVTRIRSAILFADMRDYTRTTSAMDPEAAVELLNGFFDCLVPPIEAGGGEVLKYLGDGLLAIFRDRGDDDIGRSATAALAAAANALLRLEEANRAGRFRLPVAAGIALHHGEAAYGNVGSGARLDFTVIGPDVNLASRLAQMNKVLGEPILMSRSFADHLAEEAEALGTHPLQGILEPVPIFRIRRTECLAVAGTAPPSRVVPE